MRRRFLWRVGFLFFLVILIACALLAFLSWLITLSFSRTGMTADSFVALRPVGLVAFVVAVVVLLFTFRSIRRAIGPVGDVIDAAQQVADGNYGARVRERGPREVRSLIRAFNKMATQLQVNDEQRRQMLADVSHELRTPLTVIQGNLEGVLDGVYPMDREHLEPVLDETRQLSRLIDDLRTLALAESGALHLQRESTDLAVLISETVASFRAQANHNRTTLLADVEPNLPNVWVDPARIRQVLENLIANALRYAGNDGEIRITAQVDTTKNVRIGVQDTGQGIPAEELTHIFERFYKTRDSRGTGLGLAIVKSLVEAHGGEISAESTVGKGTTIWFRLPLEQDTAQV